MASGENSFKKGKEKTGGRQKGVQNTLTREIKDAFKDLLDNNTDKMQGWLDKVASKDPEKALYIMLEASKRFVPTLSSVKSETKVEVTDGTKFTLKM